MEGAKVLQLDLRALAGPACLTFDCTYTAKLLLYTIAPLLLVALIALPTAVASFGAPGCVAVGLAQVR